MVEPVTGWVGQHRKSASLMNRCDDGFGTKRFSNHGISLVVTVKGSVTLFKSKGENMHKASLQEAADLHAGPEGGNVSTR